MARKLGEQSNSICMVTTMAKRNVFRRMAIPGLIGSMLVCQEYAQAQQQEAGPVQLQGNEQVIRSWQQNNLGGAGPALVREDDGGTRLEWKGGLTVDAYANDVSSAGGALNTPLRTGTFYKNTFNGDLRAIRRDNIVDYFQLGATTSNDLAVLSQRRYQINNLQIGRTGEGYMLAMGDVAPNFSSLSSALGVRGLYGQRQFQDMAVSGFAGVVAESWEALDNKVPRTQYLKDVYGIKLEKAFGPALKTYLTTQGSSEREPTTVLASPITNPWGKSRSFSGGFLYQQDKFTVAGETASSNYDDGGTNNRQGRASIIDGSWRGDALGFRAGYHNITSGFTSLSLGAQPGIREAYAGVDWTAASWVTLATDVRNSKATTLATAAIASTYVETNSVATRANINFGPNLPGWALAIQQAESRSINSAAQASRNSDLSSTLNYASPVWNSGIGVGHGKVTSELSPGTDSINDNWAFNIGRNFNDALQDVPQTWTAGVNFATGAQTQRLLAGGKTVNTNYTFTITAQRTKGGSLNFLATAGETTQPNGAPSLRLQGLQLEGVYPVTAKTSFKVYLRSTRRNIDDPLLSSRENIAGLQLTVSF